MEQFNSQFKPPGLFLVFEPLPYKNKPKTISCIQAVQEVKPGLVHEKLVFQLMEFSLPDPGASLSFLHSTGAADLLICVLKQRGN